MRNTSQKIKDVQYKNMSGIDFLDQIPYHVWIPFLSDNVIYVDGIRDFTVEFYELWQYIEFVYFMDRPYRIIFDDETTHFRKEFKSIYVKNYPKRL
jgi:hypothetical protein